MASLPLILQRVGVPPLKCQGIKTKLVPFIASQVCWHEQADSTWIEPFLGSGVVALNLLPNQAVLTDSNPHIVEFYQAIQARSLTQQSVRQFLTDEGNKLLHQGEDYYYQVRQRFNQTGNPLDFLFLNRACFNGLMRFNRQGNFNVPFCRKPQRFSQSYITKIANQVDWAAQQMAGKTWEFRVADWLETLQAARPEDFVYLDPPYIGRHTDYFNQWNATEAQQLATVVRSLPCGFAASMWLKNRHRQNDHIHQAWHGLEMRVQSHFYHVGSRENWRNPVTEALLIKPGFASGSVLAASSS